MEACSPIDAQEIDCDLDRRSEARQTSVLRLALIDADGITQLCRITNVSVQGLQATVFGFASAGMPVRIRVPEDITLEGVIVWAKGHAVGIKLSEPLAGSALLRFGGGPASKSKRRRLPRIEIAAPARLQSGITSYAAELLDISPAGAMVRIRGPLPGLGPIILDVLGLPRVAGQIRWAADGRAGLLFNQAIELRTLTDWIIELCSPEAIDDTTKMEDYVSIVS